MSTYDNRLAALERKVAMLELQRMHDERKAEESTPSALGINLKEINENMTILLGVVGNQGLDIKAIKEDLHVMRDDVDGIKVDLGTVKASVEALEQNVNKRFEALEQSVSSRFEAQDKKLDQVLLVLSVLTSKPPQET